MGKTTPKTFDMDAWLAGLSRPQRSVRIYQRGDLMARLDVLAAQIERADAQGDMERTLGDGSTATSLRAEYAEVAAEMEAAALTVTVQGHDADEKKELLAGGEASSLRARGRVLLHDALVSPEMSWEQFERFMGGIGPAQEDRIADAYSAACSVVAEPSADFLPQSSTPDEER